jgi:hypothetical protein
VTTYVSQGPRGPVKGIADTTGRNPGKWTVTFDPAVLNCTLPYFEICRIVVSGALGSTFTVYVDTFIWDNVNNGNINAWDPNVAIPVRPGQYIYFFWSDADTDGTPPSVQVWIRYDQDIIANKNAQFGNQPSGSANS